MSDALAAWTPAPKVFIRRCLIVAAITLVVMALFGWGIGVWTGFWQILYVGPVLALTYNIGFEEPIRWRTIRQNRWYLRTDAIIHYGAEGETRIPLAEITDVRTRFGWSVILYLKDKQRVRMAYLPDSAGVAMQIRAARARLLS